MRQMAHAVMYAVRMAPPETLENGWYSLIEQYDAGPWPPPDTPCACGDGDHDFLGFWIAVGASGEDGYPGLDEPFALDGFANVKTYKPALTRARKGWSRFAKWCVTRGILLPEPQLYLVMTEVA